MHISINVIHYQINKKQKSHEHLYGCRKAFYKIQYSHKSEYRGEISLNFMLKAERRNVFSFEEQRNNRLHKAKILKITHIILLAAMLLVQNLQTMVYLIVALVALGEKISYCLPFI